MFKLAKTSYQKAKHFFSPIFDPQKREAGIAFLALLLIPAIIAVVGGGVYLGVGWLSAEAKTFLLGMMTWFAQIVIVVGRTLATEAGAIYGTVITNLTNSPITRDPLFLIGWGTVRDIANLLIVVAFIGIALAFILKLSEYGSKKTLTTVILVALLVNFSPVFVGLFIDVSNTMVNTFLGRMTIDPTVEIITSINTSYRSQVARVNDMVPTTPAAPATDEQKLAKASALAGVNVLFAATYFIVGLTFFYFIIIFIQRYIILAMLFILSPGAFGLLAVPVPKAKELFNSWWQHFLKWCFVGVGGSFFLYLATEMLKGMGSLPVNNNSTQLNLLVVLGFLYAGLKITKAQAGPVADVVIGMAKKAGGFAAPYAMATAKWAGKATGAGAILAGKGAVGGTAGATGGLIGGLNGLRNGTGFFAGMRSGAQTGVEVARQAKEGVKKAGRGAVIAGRAVAGLPDRGLEAAGIYREGTYNAAQKEQQAADLKPYESLAGAESNNEVIARRAMNASSPAERVAHAQELEKRNELQRIAGRNPAETERLRRSALADARGMGVDTSKWADSHYEFAGLDDERVQTVATQRGITPAAARNVVVEEKLRSILPSMKPKQLRNINYTDLTPDIVDEKFTPSMVNHLALASMAHINQMQGPVRTELSIRYAAAMAAGNDREMNRLSKTIDAIDALA